MIFCTTYNSKMEKGQALDFLWIEIFLNAFVVLIMILRITSKIEGKGIFLPVFLNKVKGKNVGSNTTCCHGQTHQIQFFQATSPMCMKILLEMASENC